VDDVIGLPFAPDELLETALSVLAARSEKPRTEVRLAPMIAVVRSIGGCGATSIATHLAPALADLSNTGRDALLVDLDLQFGSVADVLSAQGRGTITDLLDAGRRLDDDLIRSVVRTSEDGVHIIAAPQDIVPLESIDTDQMLRVLDHLRRSFGFVVLDLPANWTNWTLSAAVSADVIVLVVELSVASLRQAKRRLDLFRSVGISADHVAVVVNRVEKRLFRTISLGDVADTLHHPVLASVALDEPVVSAAQDQGRLVRSLHRRSAFAADVNRLAEALLAGPLGERP
jgi:pilus assembly protein CpaE